MAIRINQIKDRFKETSLPIIYCNQVIAHDGIIFDGRSFCFDGTVKLIGKAFEPDCQIVEFKNNKLYPAKIYDHALSPQEEIYRAMTLGVRDYVRNNGFAQVVLGLSGGIDSAMVAAIAVDALGADNVLAIMLPSKFTSSSSINDACEVAVRLKIKLITIPINNILGSFINDFDGQVPLDETSITYQNLQSRIRGTILMAKANSSNSLLLTTGNKSEYATGYATIYGDMNGAFNPIKDIYKTELYEIAKYKNSLQNIFPDNILTKAPTAELAANQKDTDSLPPYEILDKILESYLEGGQNKAELSQQFDPKLVERVIRLIHNSEFKRRQAAPGVKVSSKNFEKDRRFPITNAYRDN